MIILSYIIRKWRIIHLSEKTLIILKPTPAICDGLERLPKLTPMETEVLRLKASGVFDMRFAEGVSSNRKTNKNHIHAIISTLGVNGIGDSIVTAYIGGVRDICPTVELIDVASRLFTLNGALLKAVAARAMGNGINSYAPTFVAKNTHRNQLREMYIALGLSQESSSFMPVATDIGKHKLPFVMAGFHLALRSAEMSDGLNGSLYNAGVYLDLSPVGMISEQPVPAGLRLKQV